MCTKCVSVSENVALRLVNCGEQQLSLSLDSCLNTHTHIHSHTHKHKTLGLGRKAMLRNKEIKSYFRQKSDKKKITLVMSSGLSQLWLDF